MTRLDRLVPGCRRWAALLVLVLLGGAALVAGLASGPVSATPSVVGARAQLAERDDAMVLAHIALPVGATRSADDPPGAPSELAQPACSGLFNCTTGEPLTHDLVGKTAFWIVPGAPASVLAFVAAHLPKGWTLFERSASASTFAVLISLPARGTLLSPRQLALQLAPLGSPSQTVIRADAQDVWLPPRAALPASVRVIDVQLIRETFGQHRSAVGSPPIRISRPVTVRRIVSAVNAMEIDESTAARSCPEIGPTIVVPVVTFRHASAGKALAVLRLDTTYCANAQLTIATTRQPPLLGSATVIRRIPQIAHRHLR
jgi:hypothetical protein